MTQYNGLYKFRRVLGVVLALAVLLMMTPVWGMTADSAEAAEPEHNHSGWTEWTSTNSLPSSAGDYYLTVNVSIPDGWTMPSGETNLCLNGKTISNKLTVPSGGVLRIYDEGGGQVTNSIGRALVVNDGGKAYIYAGTFENSTSSGHCIDVRSGGFIQIDGGTFIGASGYSDATISIYGEGIINNANVSGGCNAVYSRDSGKVYIYGGNFRALGFNTMAVGTGAAYMYINMTNGGVISNDVSGNYAINVLGTAEIDYAITSGSSTAINVNSSASATINGGSFNSTSNDTVTNSGTLTITGGSFTGKQYAVKNSGTFKLSGSPTFSDDDADIYLASGKKINITDALSNPTPYSVSTAAIPTKSSSVEFTNSSTTSYNDKTKFTPVNSSYIVRKNSNDQLELAVPNNPRTVTFDFDDGVTETKTVIYEDGDTYGELPTPPARTDHKFMGWYTEADGKGTKIESTATVTDDLTLYAYWEAETGGNSSGTDDNNSGGTSGGSSDDNTHLPSTDGSTSQQPSTGDSDPSDSTSEPTDSDPSTGDSEPSDTDTGDVNIGSASSENAPEVTISEEETDKLKEEIIAEHLTDEEKAAIESGDTLDIILQVEDAGDSTPAEDKQVTETVLNDTEYTVGMYLNVDLIKLINGVEVGKITELNSPIHVTVEIPEELRGANRAFAIVRVHDGKADILEDVDDDPNTITILTDRFSTYSIAYRDTEPSNPDTGTATPIAITGLACAVIAVAAAVKRKKITE